MMPRVQRFLISLLSVCFVSVLLRDAFGQDGREAILVEGRPFTGSLVGLERNAGRILFQVDGSTRAVDVEELVRWGECAEATRGSVVCLTGGGRLVGDIVAASTEEFLVDGSRLGTLRLAHTDVRAVVFRTSRVEAALGMTEMPQEDDRLDLDNGDAMTGRFQGMAEDRVVWETPVGTMEIDSRRVRALYFASRSEGRPVADTVQWILGFRDGSRLLADTWAVEETTVTIEAIEDLSVMASLSDLVYLAPRTRRLVYLSDLPVADYRHVGFLDLAWPYRLDRSVEGHPLRGGGRMYLKGIGMHSASRITYTRDGADRLFQALLAIDDETGGMGSARFRVFVDGEPAYVSDTIRGGDKPVPISVELDGARRLDLVVDFADRADQGDHANWLDARLAR